MKKIIILLLVLGFTKAYSQEPIVPVAKKVVNKFIKFGIKASVNSNESPEKLAADVKNFDDAVGKINGVNIGFYSQIKVLMLYVRPELHFTTYETNFGNVIGNIKTSRIEAPVSVGIKILPILSGFAGPTFRYKLKGDEKKLETITSNATMGVHFGVRVHMGKLGIDVRLDRAISKEETKLLGNNDVSDVEFDSRPNTISVGLSYAF